MTSIGFPSGSKIKVESSNIASLQYSGDETSILRVEFTSGAVYDYQNVTPEEYDFLLGGTTALDGTSGSIGAAFHWVIRRRPRLHPYRRIQ